MQNILKIKLNGYQKALLWGTSLTALTLKVLLDWFFLLVEDYNAPFPLILRLVFSIISFIPLLVIFFSNLEEKLSYQNTNFEKYTSEQIKIIIFYLVILIFTPFLPDSIIGGGVPRNFFQIILINSFAFASLILALMTLQFFFKWIWHRRFKRTKIYIKLIVILSAMAIIFMDLPNHFIHLDPETIRNNTTYFSINLIINILLIIITLLAAKKKEWIASLTIGDKWKLLGLSFAMIVFAAAMLSIDASYSGDGRLTNSLKSIFPASSLFGIATIIILLYSIRIALATIITIPTSKIIERKYSDIYSLTYLNKIISRSINLKDLIETVSRLSLVSGSASVVWSDLTDGKGRKSIYTLVTSEELAPYRDKFITRLDTEFYRDKTLEMFSNLNSPYHIESIPDFENPAIKKLEKIIFAKSLIIVPLLSSSKRIGTLYIAHTNEYGFDSDFLTLLAAFSDNLNIAIENIRLLQESIEKEKYKKELKIAREIEQKLIPEHLPDLNNFSLAGYTIPADEVGGDYYDLIYLKDGKPCILIGDVSGKGMSAAFYMVLLKGVVISLKNQVESVKELLTKINDVLYQQMEKQMFITMSAVKIEDEKGNISLARAGHMPFLIKKDKDIEVLRPNGIGLGLTSSNLFDSTLEEINYKLNNNENLIMYSDGAVEIFKDGKEIDSDFLKQIINKSVYKNSGDLIDNIVKEIEKLKENHTIVDDMTLVCITYNNGENNG